LVGDGGGAEAEVVWAGVLLDEEGGLSLMEMGRMMRDRGDWSKMERNWRGIGEVVDFG
jgi:hypothetical protein